jgi:hypothetical protein
VGIDVGNENVRHAEWEAVDMPTPGGETITEENPIVQPTDVPNGVESPVAPTASPESQVKSPVMKTDAAASDSSPATHTPQSTQSPVFSPTPTLTYTVTPTNVLPSQTPTIQPTIPPDRCKNNPHHRNYCTPTPSP